VTSRSQPAPYPAPSSDRPDGTAVTPDDTSETVPGPGPGTAPLVDWSRVGRRVGATAAVLAGLTVVVWLVAGLLGDGLTLRSLAGWGGLALGLMFVAEVVLVGGAALRGMLRAGARGERLAGGDVSILPPQLTRRRRRGD
jgi:hypothetical protein